MTTATGHASEATSEVTNSNQFIALSALPTVNSSIGQLPRNPNRPAILEEEMTTLYHSSTSLLTFGTPIIADGDTDYYPNVVQKLEEASDVLGLVAAHVSTSGA